MIQDLMIFFVVVVFFAVSVCHFGKVPSNGRVGSHHLLAQVCLTSLALQTDPSHNWNLNSNRQKTTRKHKFMKNKS